MEKIILKATDNVFIRDGGGEVGCGTINNDGHLYFIDKPNGVASRLPDKYKDTPMYLIPSCGGYQDGLIMVSLYGKLDLQYYHEFSGSAGMWGWIDLEGNEVIPPQYIYAYSFEDGEAIVCKGVWEIDDQNRYWCKNEKWGIINTKGEEIVPFMFDEIDRIENTEKYILCHEGGWKDGHYCVFDVLSGKNAFVLDFDFDNGYMFNECYFDNDHIIFDQHNAGEGTDYVYAYSLLENQWTAYKEIVEDPEYDKDSHTVNVDGKDIIVY